MYVQMYSSTNMPVVKGFDKGEFNVALQNNEGDLFGLMIWLLDKSATR